MCAAHANGDGVDDEIGGVPVRPTVTRVTPNSLELHKIKEQERRAREKQLLAKLQVFFSFLFMLLSMYVCMYVCMFVYRKIV